MDANRAWAGLRKLKYTICFVTYGTNILLLKRRYSPNAGLLNGLGGKIETFETPYQCVLREVKEEAGVSLRETAFGGIVTWSFNGVKQESSDGMYVYLATLPPGFTPEEVAKETDEGALQWHPLSLLVEKLCVKKDFPLVSNIPHFVLPMLAGAEPVEYHCRYVNNKLQGVEVRPLPENLWFGSSLALENGS